MNSRSESRNSINGKIQGVETAIQNVAKLRKDLEENSVNVRAEVQKSVSVHLDLLRQREIQLLRQVDALISHQSALLQCQLSKLYQVLGRFKAASQWGTENELKINPDEMESISTRHISYLPNFEKDLSSAIASFGRFEAQGAPTNVLLLPDEEEYGDGDHHVLHKQLQENKIKVCFPKLSNRNEDWLLERNSGAKHDDFDMCDAMSCSSFNSIELISNPSVRNNKWLLNGSNNCGCEDDNVEIENICSLSCLPNQPMGGGVKIPELKSICKSNDSSKICASYEQCICDESCLVTSLKGQMKRFNRGNEFQQQDCINEAIKEATKQKVELKWLKSCSDSSTLDCNSWLLAYSDFNRSKSKRPQESNDNKWLMAANESTTTSSPTNTIENNGQNLEKWLFNEKKNAQSKDESPYYIID